MLRLVDAITKNVRETLPALRQAEAAAKEKKASAPASPAPAVSSWSVVDGLAKSLATSALPPTPAGMSGTSVTGALMPPKQVSQSISQPPPSQSSGDGWDVDFDIDDEPLAPLIPAPSIPSPPPSLDSNTASSPAAKPKSTSISSLKKSTKVAKPAVTKLKIDDGDDAWEDF